MHTSPSGASTETPEPAGGGKAKRAGAPIRHPEACGATRLHYDFRLELDGVLKSWAVTRARASTRPTSASRCAPRTIRSTTASFEGTIPKGQYGGGTVHAVGQRHLGAAQDDPHEGLEEGQAEVRLHGER